MKKDRPNYAIYGNPVHWDRNQPHIWTALALLVLFGCLLFGLTRPTGDPTLRTMSKCELEARTGFTAPRNFTIPVRNRPFGYFTVIARVPPNTLVGWTGEYEHKFYSVELISGVKGWIYGDHLVVTEGMDNCK